MRDIGLRLVLSADGSQLQGEVRSADGTVQKFGATLNEASKGADNLAKRMDSAGQSMQKVGRNLSLGLTAPILAAATASAKLAIEAEEVAAKFDVVFRGSIERANSELARLREFVPESTTKLKELAAGVQDLLVPFGLARGEAAELSITAIELAADLAAFNNTGVDEALEKIRAGLIGSSEPLTAFGIDVREASLQSVALEQGLIRQGEELTRATRAQAVFAAIVRDSGDAIGTAAAEADGNAAQLRQIKADIVDAAEAIGRDMLPVVSELITGVRGITEHLAGMDEATRRNVLLSGAAVALIGPSLIALGSLIRSLVAVRAAIIAINVAARANPLVAVGALIAGLVPIMAAAAKGMRVLRQDEVQPLTVGLLAMGDAAKEASRQITAAFNSQEVAEVDSAIQAITAEINALQTVLERSTTDKLILGGFGQDDEIRAQIELLVEDRRVLLERAEALDRAAESEQNATATTVAGTDAANKNTAATNAQKDAIAAAISALESFGTEQEQLALIEADRVAQIQELVDNQDALAASGIDLQAAIAAVNRGAAEQVEAVTGAGAAADAWRAKIDALIKPLTDADEELLQLQLALEEATNAGDLDRVDQIIDKMDELADRDLDIKIKTDTQSIEAALQLSATLGQSLKDLGATEGEFQAITAVLNGVALAQGIIAIVAAGQAPPPAGIAGMLAAIGVVAPLLANLGVSISGIGAIGDGGSDGAAQQQQTQGTGTVLGDFEADSESILNALEITADATSELVGLNRGMLQALTSLNDSIGTASGSIARGATDIDFVEIDAPKLVENVTRAIGIAIGGLFLGPLGALLGNFVGKFVGKIIGGSSKVIDEGIAIAAGSINDAIDGVLFEAFQEVKVKKTFLSSGKLKTQTEALSDEFNNQLGLIFSAMIDSVLEAGLALGIDQAELQSRINAFEIEAQQISLMDLSAEEAQAELEAVFSAIFDDLAGFVVPFVDQFQQLGEGLAETLVRVATSVQVAEVAIERLGLQAERTGVEQFAQLAVGLVEAAGGVEEFISGFTSFFDAFASEEQKFNAVSKELAQAFDQLGVAVPGTREAMFDLIGAFDASTESGQQAIATILSLTGAADEFFTLQDQMLDAELDRVRKLSDIIREITGIELSPLDLVNQRFDALRDSAIDLGASQNELLQIEFARGRAIAALQAELEASLESSVDQLFGDGSGSLVGRSISGIQSVNAAIDDRFRREVAALQAIGDLIDDLLLSSISPLTPQERLAEARAQLDAAFALAEGGDVGALESLPGLVQQFLGELSGFTGGVGIFPAEFQATLDRLADLQASGPQAPEPVTGQQVGAIGQSASQIEQSALQQVQLASNIIDILTTLTTLTGANGIELAERFGIPLDQLVELIGVDLAALTIEQTSILGGLAEDFGLTIAELEGALNISLGELSDATSLLNDGLEQAINGLPPEIAGPLIDALAEVERSGDVGPLEALISELAPAFRNELAPFFDDIDITAQSDAQLNELGKINTGIREMVVGLERVADNLSAQNSNLDIPSFALGTGFAPGGLANTHAGEIILPAPVSDFARRSGLTIGGAGGDSSAVVQRLERLEAAIIQGNVDRKTQTTQIQTGNLSLASALNSQKFDRDRKSFVGQPSRGGVTCGA